MRRHAVLAMLALLASLAGAVALAQTIGGGGGGSSANALLWDAGSPTGDTSGNLSGSGSYTAQSGWSPSDGTMTGYFPGDIDSTGEGAGIFYQTPLSFTPTGGGPGGTWSATTMTGLPQATYGVLAIADFADGSGNTQGILATQGTALVGGGKTKETVQGTIPFAAAPTVNNGTITANGIFKSNAGWQVKLGTHKYLLIPVTFDLLSGFKPDSSRKAIPGKLTVDMVKSAWSVSVPNVPSGTYLMWVNMQITNIFDQTQSQLPFSSKAVTVP